MLKAYADVQINFVIVQTLRRRGMDVVTAQERGRHESGDAELLDEALAERRIMLTNDKDFLVLASLRAKSSQTFAPIYFWPQQGRPVGELVRRILREASVEDYPSAASRVHFL